MQTTEQQHPTGGRAVPARRMANWERQMSAVEEFVATTGRLPRDSRSRRARTSATAELRLARFLRYQRHIEEYLDDAQWNRLQALSGFEWTPIEDAWHKRWDAYMAFVRAHGRAPRRRSPNREERQLATWSYRQLLHRRNGRLPHHLVVLVDRLLYAVDEAAKTYAAHRS